MQKVASEQKKAHDGHVHRGGRQEVEVPGRNDRCHWEPGSAEKTNKNGNKRVRQCQDTTAQLASLRTGSQGMAFLFDRLRRGVK